jgi:hypothetical protein
MALLVDFQTALWWKELSPADIIPPSFTWGMNTRPVGGSTSETQSHSIDMINY